MEWDFSDEQFDVNIDPEEPVFPLNIVCKLLDLNYWTLHDIINEGLLRPQKTGRRKLLSRKDVRRLNIIKYLMEDEGVNIKGVKIILEIKEKHEK